MTLIERKQMVEILNGVLPYPAKWYKTLPEEQICALYLQHRSKPKLQKTNDVFISAEKHPQIRINEETGETEIYTDGGFWVQMD